MGTLNGEQVFNISLPESPAPQNGFVGLGTASYGLADFDNLKIMDSTDGEQHVLLDTKKRKNDKNTFVKEEASAILGDKSLLMETDVTEFVNDEDDTLYFKSLILENEE